jgi:hypothetical protein
MSIHSILEVISRQLRVLATIFLGPFIYSIVGLNSSMMRGHRMTRSVMKFLWVRFWWSVWTTICWPKMIFQNSFKQSFIDQKQFSFCCSISNLCWLQFTTVKCYSTVTLTDDYSSLIMTGINMDMKRIIKVWVQKKYFATDYYFHFIKGLLFDICPLEWDIFRCKTC